MEKTKVHKIVLMVVDHDDLGAEDVGKLIEDARYPNRAISPTVIGSATKEVVWSDDHPLNNRDEQIDAFVELFE